MPTKHDMLHLNPAVIKPSLVWVKPGHVSLAHKFALLLLRILMHYYTVAYTDYTIYDSAHIAIYSILVNIM